MLYPESCPRCSNDFKGPEIPDEDQHYFGVKYLSTVVGVEIRGVYDGVAYWQCPVCGYAFHRFDPDHSRYDAIDLFVQEIRDLYPKE